MEHAWNTGWWFKPGPAEPHVLNATWRGPEADNSAFGNAVGHEAPAAESVAALQHPDAWERVHLPHDMSAAPLNGFDERELHTRGCYAKAFTEADLSALSALFGNEGAPRAIYLRFEGVSVACRVWVNGVEVGAHRGPYTPFEVRIDENIGGKSAIGEVQAADEVQAAGRLAWIIVEVDSSEDAAIPPFGGVVDYLVFGGIYRGVSLVASAGARLGKVWGATRPRGDSLDGLWFVEIHPDIVVEDEDFASAANLRLRARLSLGDTLVNEGEMRLQDANAPFSLSIERPRLWDIENPYLYNLLVTLCDETGRTIDRRALRIGFRTAEFGTSGFYLNHRRVFLRGLNRHQEYPYAGYAMGPDAQRRDAEMLKRELGCVVVRTSHYPQSPHFLDACDELGLLVFEELPGWQHVGDRVWQDQALLDLGDMILRDRNHPSIVLWGVRINESMDSHDFYSRTNELARSLDPYRQTAGVRYIPHSELLEDVYTFNDFTYDGTGTLYITEPSRVLPRYHRGAPYMITEHTGHMFPTKRFDQEERLIAHALRHAHILDTAMGDARVSGCIGWCAFDYRTHKDFGSGDRVCYHGVADLFRIPKYAAAVYASQVAPSERIVLEPASRFAKGERDAARMLPVHVFTNCDAVDLYRGDSFIGRFLPDRHSFANLPHPPVVIDDIIGAKIEVEGWSKRDSKLFTKLAGKAMAVGASRLSLLEKLRMGLFMRRHKLSMRQLEKIVIKYGMGWGSADETFRLVGILEGKEVVERSFGADASAHRLVAEPDAWTLKASDGGEWATSRVVVKALDQYGNIAPFLFEPISIEIEGPARLIGPTQRTLVGGATAFWIAAGGAKGRVSVGVSCARFMESARFEISIE